MNFASTLKDFCGELKLTFPELSEQIDRALDITPAQFWKSWSGDISILLERDASKLMSSRKGCLLGSVKLTTALFSEISENTSNAIWKYLRTLFLESVKEKGMGDLDSISIEAIFKILTDEKGDKKAFEDSIKQLKPFFERIKDMIAKMLEGDDTDASASEIPSFPEIPEKLRTGHIAKLAESLAKQFDPADFGIDPKIMECDNIEEIFKHLTELYEKDSTLIMTGVKRVVEKIKKKIMSGSIKHEDLISEAKEFMNLFKDHPLVKEGLEKAQAFMGEHGLSELLSGGLSDMFGSKNSGAPSDRRRAVQERLRRKMEMRQKNK